MNSALRDEASAADAGQASRARWLLVLGLVAGAAAAATALLTDRAGTSLPPQAVAMVDERPILRDAWLRAVAAVAAERRTPLTGADQRRILERLIDEELLVQHGIALGFAVDDLRVRNLLVAQVMQSAATAAETEPGEQELRGFHADNADYFAPAARLRVVAWRLDADGQQRAFLPPLPDALLPPSKLQHYLGPQLTAAALSLPAGGASDPIAQGEARVVLQVIEREAGTTPPFEAIRDEVAREYQRRADEDAVRRLLADLRERHRVIIDQNLP